MSNNSIKITVNVTQMFTSLFQNCKYGVNEKSKGDKTSLSELFVHETQYGADACYMRLHSWY